MKIKTTLFIILILLNLVGCGTKDEELNDALLDSYAYIEAGDCEQAITILTTVSDQDDNPQYIKALASAYACQADYNTATLFTDLTTNFGQPSLLGQISIFSHASISDNPDKDASFMALWDAINTLLYAGLPSYVEPTSTARNAIFGEAAADINAMLFYITLEELSKYTHYYGSTGSDGIKGGASATGPQCYFSYDHAVTGITYDGSTVTLGKFLSNSPPTGNCTVPTENDDAVGHTDLGDKNSSTSTTPTQATQVARMCQGVVLMNILFDTITDMTSIITEIDTTNIDKYKAALNDTVAGMLNVLNYENCKTTYANNLDDLQRYFVLIFETLHQ